MRARGSAMGAEFRGKGIAMDFDQLYTFISNTLLFVGIQVQLGPMMYVSTTIFDFVSWVVKLFMQESDASSCLWASLGGVSLIVNLRDSKC